LGNSVSDGDNARVPLAIISGVYCLAIGLAQFLYSFLAFASVILVDLLGAGLTIASSAIAAVPDKPYEIPYARALATTIAATGVVFALVAFFSGCRSFYRRRVSRIDLIACSAICAILAALHFINSLTFGGAMYVVAVVFFSSLLLADRASTT
jgi:hypothetical protein